MKAKVLAKSLCDDGSIAILVELDDGEHKGEFRWFLDYLASRRLDVGAQCEVSLRPRRKVQS